MRPNTSECNESTGFGKMKTRTDRDEHAKQLVTRVLSEDVLSIPQAQTELKNVLGTRHDRSVLIRWIQRGVGGIKLDGIRLGRQWFTSTQAITRFIAARTSDAVEP